MYVVRSGQTVLETKMRNMLEIIFWIIIFSFDLYEKLLYRNFLRNRLELFPSNKKFISQNVHR